jgi:adenosine deaminase
MDASAHEWMLPQQNQEANCPVKKSLRNNIEQFVTEIPKMELHLHIEGAIPLETMLGLAKRDGKDRSLKTVDDLRRKLRFRDFPHFIELWTWMTTLVKEESDFEEIAYRVLRELSRQNVKYVEASYSPGDYWRQGFSVSGITENLLRGKERARCDFGVRCELIIDLIRDHGPEKSMQYLDAATPYLGKGVIGVGLGGSEQNFPPGPYAPIYKEARARGFRLTAHAGEAAGAQSIWVAVKELGVERIGHGVRAREDPQLVALLKEKQIPLDMCVTSNVKTGVCQSVEAHPIKEYFQQGLLVTINSDDPAMFSVSISQEYEGLIQRLGFTVVEIRQLTTNSIGASFMSKEDKKTMKSQFDGEWERLERKYCSIGNMGL